MGIGGVGATAEIADARQGSGLRPTDDRKRCGCAGQSQKMPSLHSITSSAGAIMVGGTLSANAFAVLTLIVNLNNSGCCKGSPAGLMPPLDPDRLALHPAQSLQAFGERRRLTR
jgi:hypothetical protein